MTPDWESWDFVSAGAKPGAEFQIIEAWIFDGMVGIAANGGPTTTRDTSPVKSTTELVLMASDNPRSVFDVSGIVVMDRLPTDVERAGIRAWVATGGAPR